MSGTALYISLLCLLSVCSACYISNCPVGGKRSLIDIPLRKCLSCGPGDRGRCFGPSICCGPGLGCYIGSPEAAACVEENYVPTPCETGGRVCGSEGGHCAAPGVCCDSEGCKADQLCLVEEEAENENSDSDFGGNILMKLLHLAGQHPSGRIHQ
ncbi:isotocin-neurophysin IT 1-like [Chanos chanos]|uniref:Isotocin-neurophysin IT 1-like n=1 Tax=Chanos chanos TaxID=29144 RepID=A0A6J2VM66_CHACN|nr:isotocin-neurophysin IT 1-like [Chanos chanos]